MTEKTPLTYADSGVDIEAGNALVSRLKPLVKATARPGVTGELGGFGGLFDLAATGYKDPVLVSGTDGVGTKILLAIESGHHATIGQDLVAMCVNDILAQGAEPLFFLDYFATGKLDQDVAETVIAGVAEGCHLSGAALIGGETAEMPDMYAQGHYDLAGFAVGAVERAAILPRTEDMSAGDVLIGLPSSGPHSNGYSLIRKVIDRSGLALGADAPFAPGMTLAEALLVPTTIYVSAVLPLLKSGAVTGLAHITGGGLTENAPRMCPDHLVPVFDKNAWTPPPVFQWIAEIGHVTLDEMARTFNMGLGMVLTCKPDDAPALMTTLLEAGEEPVICGELRAH